MCSGGGWPRSSPYTRNTMQRDIDQINVIPLVDVMLVLLVIVLTTATFISSGQIPVNLAKAKEVGNRKDAPIIITLTADGALFLNDRTVPEGGLQSALTGEPRDSRSEEHTSD